MNVMKAAQEVTKLMRLALLTKLIGSDRKGGGVRQGPPKDSSKNSHEDP